MRAVAGLAWLLLAATLVPLGAADDLAAVAARERERRERLRRSGRVYTDADLKDARESGAGKVQTSLASGTATGSATNSPAVAPAQRLREDGSAESGPEGESGGDAATWRARARQVRAEQSTAQSQLAAAQSEVARLRQRLNPMSPSFETDTNRQLQLQAQLTEAERAVGEAQAAVGAAEQHWRDFEEEARRSAVPPGWIEEPLPDSAG